MGRIATLWRQLSWIVAGVVLLCAVYLLPPDTSLADIQSRGSLTVCVPSQRPPLVTADEAMPGVDIEILQQIATTLGVRLSLNTVDAMGQDFDPQSWNLTRAQCAMLAGGLVDSVQTRSFLEVSPAYAETGWIVISPKPLPDLKGKTVGVLATVQGFDRIALSQYLRDQGAAPRLLRSGDELTDGLSSGQLDGAISEELMGEALAAGKGWTLRRLPLQSYPLVFGLWKGDLTLKRAIDGALASMQRDGRIAAILKKYGVVPQL